MLFILALEAFMLSSLWPSFHFCICAAFDKGFSMEGVKDFKGRISKTSYVGFSPVSPMSLCPREFRTRGEVLRI